MTKGTKKQNVKKYYYIKDRALVKFILSHSKKKTIDFSKIKIPSFIDYIDTKENKKSCNKYISNSNLKNMDEKEGNGLEHISFPAFKFLLLKDLNFGFIYNNDSKFKSTLFE